MCMVYLDFSRGIFLSRTHLPWSPTHIVPSWSRGDLSITNTPSLPPHASLSTFVPCWPDLYWTCAIGVSLSVANNDALAIFVYLLTSLFDLGDACMMCLHKKWTHTSLSLIYRLLSLSLSHTYSFGTLTHFPSHALDLCRLRHSPRSIAYRKVKHHKVWPCTWRKTITSRTENIYH